MARKHTDEKSVSHILITGGAGFIGHHIVEHLLDKDDSKLTIVDGLNYAGRLDRLAQWRNHPKVRFCFHNIRAAFSDSLLADLGNPDWLIHSAAETHVENSLRNPTPFIESNVIGTYNVLEAARKLKVKKFLYVSTDEVFGAAPIGVDYTEDSRFSPTNPYSSSKAAGECLVMAWAKAYQLPTVITRTMNNFGERQHPEKYIPSTIRHILDGTQVTVHWDGRIIGSRKWLHARNHADAIYFLLKRGTHGIFHIAGEEYNNLEMARNVARIMNLPLRYKLENFHSTRPGHDLRYSLADTKIRELGWTPPVGFEESLRRVVLWTQAHQEWLR